MAALPENASQRRTATSIYAGDISIAHTRRPVISPAIIVVLEPENDFVNRLPRAAVVFHGAAHAGDWILRAMRCLGILTARRDLPQGGLLPITTPASVAFDCIPARLVLPVVVASTKDEPVFGPNDLSPDFEVAGLEAVGDLAIDREASKTDRPSANDREC